MSAIRTVSLGVLSTCLASTCLLSGCKRNAATGEMQFNYFSREEEIALGIESREEILPQYGGEIPDPEIRAYVGGIGESMIPHVEEEYRDLPWEFTMLNSDVVNAFALPGGQVFVSRGLASRLGDEAELAGVVGHEMGHVTAEHVDRRMGRQMIIAGFALGVSAAASESELQWAQAAASVAVTGAGVYSLSFDRAQELEADFLGMRYMSRASYDPSALAGVMQALQSASGGAQTLEIFSTHPHPETRIEAIRDQLNSEPYRGMTDDPDYTRRSDAYQRRMLNPLAAIPAAPDSSLAALAPEQYCMVCALRRSSE